MIHIHLERSVTDIALPTVFLCNLRLINNELDELEIILNQHAIDVCAVTETWLTIDQPETSFYIDEY